MTPATLRAAGEALYGLRWQAPLARDLDVATRTVQRWADGTRGIPAGLADDIRALLKQRIENLRELVGGL